MSQELYIKLTRLQWLLQRQQIRSHAQGGPLADTARGQGRILSILRLHDGISTRDMSYLLGIRVSSLNELLAKLEKGGYVTRERSTTDRRVMLVRLTELGRNAQEPDTVDPGNVFSCLSDNEQSAFGEYINRITTALIEQFGFGDGHEYERMMEVQQHFAEMMSSHFDQRRISGLSGFLGQLFHADGRHRHREDH
jgi:DNA-binding MarR family transcriptional regulator